MNLPLPRSSYSSREPYDKLSSDVTMEMARLEARRLRGRMEIGSVDGAMYGMKCEYVQDAVARQLVANLVATVATKKYAVKTVSFPADWWQAVKRRWFPRWALKRWPVQMTDVTLEASAYYPDIRIPNHEAFVDVVLNEKTRRMRAGEDV